MIRLLALLALTPSLAVAQNNCAKRDHLIKRLAQRYGEQLTFGGLQKSRGVRSIMEVWASRETGSYTIIVTQPNGISCIVAVGTDFFEAIPAEVPTGDPL